MSLTCVGSSICTRNPAGRKRKLPKRIKRELDAMGIAWQTIGYPGVVATIEGTGEGKTIALRADMDALEVTES